MTTVDELLIRAPAADCFRIAADVERWPDILPHYRWVRFRKKTRFGHGSVEMAAWRDFVGPLRYPTWWLSEMRADSYEPAVHYRHIDGITRGMIVKWAFQPRGDDATLVRITHTWEGPDWPLIGRFAWEHVIGPYFVSAIAQRTLAGVAAKAEEAAASVARAAEHTRGAVPSAPPMGRGDDRVAERG